MKIRQHAINPSHMNKVSEGISWRNRQPGHIEQCEEYFWHSWLTKANRKTEVAHWDGTMNMPLARLADPMHKESYMMQYM